MKTVRLLSISFPRGGYKNVEQNVEHMVRHLEETAPYCPDFVCFTEVARELGCPQDSEAWMGEPVPGPTTEAIGKAAAEIGTHVIVGMQERWEDQTFNAAVLIGRDGNVMGRYHKCNPPSMKWNAALCPAHRPTRSPQTVVAWACASALTSNSPKSP